VAFMLVHCFWLLEFKFKFEFYLFEPFQISKILFPNLPYLAQQPSSINSWLWPNSEWQPRNPRTSAQLAQQPPSPSRRRGPVGLSAQFRHQPAAAAPRLRLGHRQLGPSCHPLRGAASDRDSAVAAESDTCTPSRAWPARQARVPRDI
jgi:hypothetical protein